MLRTANLTAPFCAITVGSIDGSTVMQKRYEPTRKDQFLASCATGCIAGSALLTFGMMFAVVFFMSPALMLRDHPTGLFFVIAGAVAWVRSALNLGKLRRGSTTVEPQHLWRVSLWCNLGILVATVFFFGVVGLALGIMELIAVAIHIYALAVPRSGAD